MNQSDAFRANRLAWRFKKSGASGRELRVFGDLSQGTRATLIDSAGVSPPEEAAIGLYRGSGDWMLITSRRVIWEGGGNRDELALSEVADATVDPRDLARAGTKSEVDTITIVTKDGRRKRMTVESGGALSGVWNALKMAATWK